MRNTMNRNEGVYVNVGSSQHVQQQAVAPPAANSSTRSPMKRYKNVLFSMGIVEIIAGFLSVVFGIITLVIATTNRGYSDDYYDYYDKRYSVRYLSFYHGLTYPGQGIWSGAFATVVGILGVRARSNPSKCMYNANMALSIIGALVMGASAVLSGIAAGVTSYRLPSLIAVHSMLALLGVIGLVIMIIHSAYCCAGTCCRSTQEAAVSYYPSPARMQQPQLIQLANGQYVLSNEQTFSVPQPVQQVPVLGGSTPYYHQPPQVGVPVGMPTNQSYHVAGLQTQVTSVPTATAPAAPQNVVPNVEQAPVANP